LPKAETTDNREQYDARLVLGPIVQFVLPDQAVDVALADTENKRRLCPVPAILQQRPAQVILFDLSERGFVIERQGD